MSLRRGVLLRVAAVAVGLALVGGTAHAQNLAFSLFERYLDSLRQQAGIPGLAALVSQNGVTEWERGFGQRSIERNLPVLSDTPFPVGGLTQAFSSTLALQCVDGGQATLDDAVSRWVPSSAPDLTLGLLLSHGIPGDGFRYDAARFTQLTPMIEDCFERPIANVVATEILDRLAMRASVPGTDLMIQGNDARAAFDAQVLSRYEGVLDQVATAYRLDRAGRPVRVEQLPAGLNASTGLVTSVRDLGRFASALDDDVLMSQATRTLAWSSRVSAAGKPTPAGLGWFVQSYRGEPLVWQFGSLNDGYSSLLLMLPRRRLVFALLANTDGLSAPFALANGDATVSPFAELFLRTFLP